MIRVRLAEPVDVEAMSAVLTSSIRDLCAADHHNDQAVIAGWTRNKTPDDLRGMLANRDLEVLVAELDGVIAAVGCITAAGAIALNYVAPEHRSMGVSRALLADMERRLRHRGLSTATLVSTTTAHRFYLAAGWQDHDRPGEGGHSVTEYPMHKQL